MSNLKCHDYRCRHNMSGSCYLDRIDISVNATCLDFCKGNEVKSSEEIAEEIKISPQKMKTEIFCHSCDCLNNVDCHCGLNNLRVDEVNNMSLCVNRRYSH